MCKTADLFVRRSESELKCCKASDHQILDSLDSCLLIMVSRAAAKCLGLGLSD